MSDPVFRPSQRAALIGLYMDDWTADAACRGDKRPNVLGGTGGFPAGFVWEKAFMDEAPQLNRGTIETHRWSSTILDVMEVCSTCPVRRECLTSALEEERAISDLWWSSELVDEANRFGVRGGLPGRIREVIADDDDPEASAEEWFSRQASRYGWNLTEGESMTA